jgi:hypothetical protein
MSDMHSMMTGMSVLWLLGLIALLLVAASAIQLRAPQASFEGLDLRLM